MAESTARFTTIGGGGGGGGKPLHDGIHTTNRVCPLYNATEHQGQLWNVARTYKRTRKPVPPLIELDISQGGALEKELDASSITLSPPPELRHLNPKPEPRLRKQRQVSRPFITDRIEWAAVEYDTTKSPGRGSICTRDDIGDKLSQRGDEWIIGELCARWGWTPEDLLRTIQLPLPHRPRRLVPNDRSTKHLRTQVIVRVLPGAVGLLKPTRINNTLLDECKVSQMVQRCLKAMGCDWKERCRMMAQSDVIGHVTSYDALQRCKQVRKLWDSMKIPLAKERSQLDRALAMVMEAKGKDETDEGRWREQRNDRRKALITFVERAQTEWRWRLRVAKLDESDWTSGNITEEERAIVEAIMAMPRYIDEIEVAPPAPPVPVKRSISSLPWHERPHGPPLKRSATTPTVATIAPRPRNTTNAKASSSKVTLDDELEREALQFAEVPQANDEQRCRLRSRGFFTYVKVIREWAEEEAQKQLESRRWEVFGDLPDDEMELEALTDMHLLVFQGVYRQARLLLQDAYQQHIGEHAKLKESSTHLIKNQHVSRHSSGIRFEEVAQRVRVDTRKARADQQSQIEANFLATIIKPDLSERDRVRMSAEYQRRRGEQESKVEREIERKVAVAKEKWLAELEEYIISRQDEEGGRRGSKGCIWVKD
ncbi:uncharacterized protein STEHIDRAFT_139279 [Stereum hirsutum FP-91666 SS1]|uniref:uncharacterized protein n=1 Tax=Stereum hirsutum (strain FP-91666) TaxID=721885 RepID=UPI000440DF98|nr:uncharacterized protein STEHIDRAFT_139279 [Stereum hirsutum FP-91666 SS1]EIM87694.1 hypothetical protein STEHIDRAFT_139279 [Stereum hirsutum FP-91666 SS1]